jgi:hypothetical protein
MKTVPKLQQVITQLLHQHAIDVDNPEALLWLTIPVREERLIIERIDPWQLSVGFTREVGDNDYLLAPEIVLFTDEQAWLPLRAFPGNGVRGMVGLADDLAQLIEQEGWITHGLKLPDPPRRAVQDVPWTKDVANADPDLPNEEDVCALPYE